MNKKLIICFDGIPYNMFSKENTPFLYDYAKKNHSARLKPIYAFTGIEYSFFDGRYPDESNIWLEHKYSPETSPFNWQKYFRFLGRSILNLTTFGLAILDGRRFITRLYEFPYLTIHNFDFATRRGIWQTKLFQKKRYICYKWPFLVKNNKLKLKFKYESDKDRCKTLIKNISQNIDLYNVQLVGLDKAIHKHGRNSKQAKQKMEEIDSLIKFTIQKFKDKIPNIETYIWSDHGFIDIKKYINLQRLIPKSKDYLALYGGTASLFWFKNNKIKEEVIQILSKQKFGFILTEKQRKKYRIPKSKEHGDLIFAMNPEYYTFPNYYQTKNPIKSMHSYISDKTDLDAIFVTNKSLNKKSLTMVEAHKFIKNEKTKL